jgi:acyl carrier protein
MEQKFIDLFAETLELESSETLSKETVFRELEQWDSLAFLSVIAMIDEEFDVVIEGNDFQKLLTIGDILNKIEEMQS